MEDAANVCHSETRIIAAYGRTGWQIRLWHREQAQNSSIETVLVWHGLHKLDSDISQVIVNQDTACKTLWQCSLQQYEPVIWEIGCLKSYFGVCNLKDCSET
jgi:hypothetical protein